MIQPNGSVQPPPLSRLFLRWTDTTFEKRYDTGRDDVVKRATVEGGTKSPLTNRTFVTTVANASGIGYYANVSTSEINHGVATDGVVAILTVKVTSNGSIPDQVIGSVSLFLRLFFFFFSLT